MAIEKLVRDHWTTTYASKLPSPGQQASEPSKVWAPAYTVVNTLNSCPNFPDKINFPWLGLWHWRTWVLRHCHRSHGSLFAGRHCESVSYWWRRWCALLLGTGAQDQTTTCPNGSGLSICPRWGNLHMVCIPDLNLGYSLFHWCRTCLFWWLTPSKPSSTQDVITNVQGPNGSWFMDWPSNLSFH